MNARWSGVRRLLAVRLDKLGDVLMTTPALAALAESLPDARLTLLASKGGVAAAVHVPAVHDLIAFEAPWVAGFGKGKEAAASARAPQNALEASDAGESHASLGLAEARLVDRLADARFDAAVIFTVCTQSALPAALLCRMAGIPLRLAHCREDPCGLLTDWVRDFDVVADGMRHEVERQLALVASVGCYASDERLRFRVTAAHREACVARLARAGLAALARYFVVHVGASAPARRYPAERFGVAADSVAARHGLTAVFTGDAGEHALVEQARGAMQAQSLSLAGQLDLGELGALLEGAELLIANNTGPVHLAAAVGTPVVDLYALTHPHHTPWQVAARVLNHDVPCRNCLHSICPQGHHACLLGVRPEAVADAARDLLGTVAPAGRRRPPGPALHAPV